MNKPCCAVVNFLPLVAQRRNSFEHIAVRIAVPIISQVNKGLQKETAAVTLSLKTTIFCYACSIWSK